MHQQQAIWEERRENWTPRENDARTAYEVDYARINHSSSFRRLQGKTQVISQGDGDFHRTRLTHSLEVSQIALGIAQRLRGRELPAALRTHVVDPSLIQTIALVHDLGHPPFGHGGEEALNCAMRSDGGFEGNGQTLRILTRLEDFSVSAGANLTRRTLLGALKYPVSYSQALDREIPSPLRLDSGVPLIRSDLHSPPKCYLDTEKEVVAWLLSYLPENEARQIVRLRAKSVDASLMDVADDLAYSVADTEDAIALRLITRDQLLEDVPVNLWDDYIEYTRQRRTDDLFGDADGIDTIMESLFGGGRELKRQIGRMMGYCMARVEVKERPHFSDPLYSHEFTLRPEARALVEALKKSILQRVILSPRVQHGRLQGQMMILRVMDVMRNDPRHHFPEKRYQAYVDAGEDPRVICDWVAGSTEGFLTKLHERIFTPGAASVSDRL